VTTPRPTPVARCTGGYWPSPIQELLLRAALLSGTDAREAWCALRPGLDVDGADRASRRLLPLLGANLRRLGIDDPLAAGLEAIHRDTAAKNRRLFDAGRRLLTALAEAGIATLVLKGGALASHGYRDLGLRPMSDLDVVVPTGQADAAVQALERAGWEARTPVTPALVRMRHATDLLETGTSFKCDLHWHVYWECCAPDADDDLWAASVPLDFEGVPTRTLGPADQLLHLCVHGSRRARRPLLLWIPDALLVLRAGGIDWPRLLAQGRRRRFVLRAATMLAYLRRQLGAPVPDEVLARLEALPISRLERLEYRVVNRPQGLLGELPGYWCHYRRLRADGQITSTLGFPRYLQQTWRMASLGRMGRGALDRARKRVRAAVLGSTSATGR
jgi:hypothetical protein